ncbi:uncharacterized protein [Rutidosis leptorrhynchoides]|uniref:uncharacterized protein n=1 Tax=Rutidosis leptorrhynchoides TaxID=125765 RepID=UPI003A9A2355
MLKCKVDIELWDRIRKWWTLNSINISSISETFEDKNPNISSPQGRKIWQAITWVTGYTLWKNRNECVFEKNKSTSASLFKDIQAKSFEWVSSRWKKGNIEWLNWLSNPLSYAVSQTKKKGIG